MFFEGFTKTEIKTAGARIVTVHGGKGPPLLLLHGNPFSHLSWHKFAPRLAQRFHRGGDGFARLRRFRKAARRQEPRKLFVPRHGAGPGRGDGGARPQALLCRRPRSRRPRAAPHVPRSSEQAVARAAILDIIPQHHVLNNVTRQWGTFSWHWFFMIQPEPFPEHLMSCRSGFFHQQEARQDRTGPELLRSEGARRIPALFPQSRDRPRHVRGLSRHPRHRS